MQSRPAAASRPFARPAVSQSDDDDQVVIISADAPAQAGTSDPCPVRPAPLSPHNAATAVVEFLEIALQAILSHREVYPPTAFEPAMCYGAVSPTARHPLLQSYVSSLIALVAGRLRTPGHYRVIVPLLSPGGVDSAASQHIDPAAAAAAGHPDAQHAASAAAQSTGPLFLYPTVLPLERYVIDVVISAAAVAASAASDVAAADETAAAAAAATPLPLLSQASLSRLQYHLGVSLVRLSGFARASPAPPLPRGAAFRLVLCDNADDAAGDACVSGAGLLGVDASRRFVPASPNTLVAPEGRRNVHPIHDFAWQGDSEEIHMMVFAEDSFKK